MKNVLAMNTENSDSMKIHFIAFALGLSSLGTFNARADNTAQTLPFAQDWSNAGLITTDDIWSGVPGFIGYRGDDLTVITGTDPATILADGTGTPVDVIANQANPATQTTGGVAEFAIANNVVALQGSGTADAPFLLLHLDAVGKQAITVSYNLRDVDGSLDNSVQPVALQYRVGNSGDFVNAPAAYVADASSGPSLATLVTPVSVTLPAPLDNQPLVQIRWITANAAGSDEWIGIDDISVTADPYVPVPARYSIGWYTMDGGGGTSTGSVRSVSGTIGQPDAGWPMTNGRYAVTGGFWAFAQAIQVPGAPTLTIVSGSPGNATVSWMPNTPGFVLQESASLSPANWTNSPSGATNPIVVPASLPVKFYRLFKP